MLRISPGDRTFVAKSTSMLLLLLSTTLFNSTTLLLEEELVLCPQYGDGWVLLIDCGVNALTLLIRRASNPAPLNNGKHAPPLLLANMMMLLFVSS
jgi:hypothetical protein